MSEKPTHFTIREWSKDDRPRKKNARKRSAITFKCRIVSHQCLSKGGIASTTVDVRLVLE